MIKLAEKKCVPCEGGTPPLANSQIEKLRKQISDSWVIKGEKQIKREFKFGGFKQAMEFVNKIADIAEVEGHHPDMEIRYNKVKICLMTHAIGGLSENDFILASKIELI